MELGDKYNLKYSGMIIEQYTDEVQMPFERMQDISNFKFFGGMLLKAGGELGMHGYNHMPLCLSNVDYTGYFETYVNFRTIEDMMASLKELEEFIGTIFPDVILTTYVPPSNVLSDEGRSMIRDYLPEIKVIASTYFEGDIAYEQEFEVSTDGIIEFSRVISGCSLDNFMAMGAFSELNLHYVNSHFMHPDDVLDPDRGANEGWESLKVSFEEYLSWLYTAAPDIRNLTATEGALAIETFDNLTVKRTLTETSLKLELGGFNGSIFQKRKIDFISFLKSRSFLDIIEEMCSSHYYYTRFSELFHSIRSMMLPIIYLMTRDIPKADIYHSICTGYGGLLGTLGSWFFKRPFILTEHGIYTREREEEIIRAKWVMPYFKNHWIKLYYMLAKLAYKKADRVTSLFYRA